MRETTAVLKQQMHAAASRAYTCGLQSGNGGNLSARPVNALYMVIKASGKSFGECSPETLITIDYDGHVLEGALTPSREYLTHASVYRARPEVHAIMHCHAPFSIAMAALVDDLPFVTHHMQLKLGAIPVLTVDAHADVTMAEHTTRFLAQHPGIKAFIHRKHGLFSFGADIAEAEHNAELVEESAKIALLIRLGGLGTVAGDLAATGADGMHTISAADTPQSSETRSE